MSIKYKRMKLTREQQIRLALLQAWTYLSYCRASWPPREPRTGL